MTKHKDGGNWWKTVETSGNQWKPVETIGNQWKPVETSGNTKSKTGGNRWKSVKTQKVKPVETGGNLRLWCRLGHRKHDGLWLYSLSVKCLTIAVRS